MSSFDAAVSRSGSMNWVGNLVSNQLRTDSEIHDSTFVVKSPNDGFELVSGKKVVAHFDEALVVAAQSERAYESLEIKKRFSFVNSFLQQLREKRELLAQALKADTGAPHWEAVHDINSAVRFLEQATENHEEICKAMVAPCVGLSSQKVVRFRAIGTTICFVPLSSPLQAFVQGLVAGCISGSPILFVSSPRVGFLTGVLNTLLNSSLGEVSNKLVGSVQAVSLSFSDIKSRLNDERIKGIIFTGSRASCDDIRKITSRRPDIQLMLQSGGKNSVIVHSSSSVEDAVKGTLLGIVKGAGQLCTSTSRAIVYENQLDDFLSGMKEAVRNLSVGNTELDETVMMGPLYSEKAVDKFERFQTMARRESKSCVVQGARASRVGFSVTPGIWNVGEYNPQSAYQSNVLFSPDLAVYSYNKFDEALEIANATDAPYVVSYFGEGHYLTHKRELIDAPVLVHNLPTAELGDYYAVAGRGQSGNFRFNSYTLAMRLCYPQLEITQDSELGSIEWLQKK